MQSKTRTCLHPWVCTPGRTNTPSAPPKWVPHPPRAEPRPLSRELCFFVPTPSNPGTQIGALSSQKEEPQVCVLVESILNSEDKGIRRGSKSPQEINHPRPLSARWLLVSVFWVLPQPFPWREGVLCLLFNLADAQASRRRPLSAAGAFQTGQSQVRHPSHGAPGRCEWWG